MLLPVSELNADVNAELLSGDKDRNEFGPALFIKLISDWLAWVSAAPVGLLDDILNKLLFNWTSG